jgi:hypothetical protein
MATAFKSILRSVLVIVIATLALNSMVLAKQPNKGHSKGHHNTNAGAENPADNLHSNKGGTERGLERSNSTAGEHGEQGRANAADKHK